MTLDADDMRALVFVAIMLGLLCSWLIWAWDDLRATWREFTAPKTATVPLPKRAHCLTPIRWRKAMADRGAAMSGNTGKPHFYRAGGAWRVIHPINPVNGIDQLSVAGWWLHDRHWKETHQT